MRRISCLVAIGVWMAASTVFAAGNLYGTIHTRDGRALTGPIHWDNNENFWDDVLDANKKERVEHEAKGFKLNLFGLKLGGEHRYTAFGFSIPFGHLRSIERTGNREARIELKSGETVDLQASGSDIGSGLRRVLIDDAEHGTQELSWASIDRVEFAQDPGDGRDSQRLYGTVETRSGSYLGYIIWDRDETMAPDELDGSEDGVDHEIPFGEIRKIERVSGGSRVTLKNGDMLTLTGTNDVDEGHRGVAVRVAGVGTVDLDWWEVDNVVFADPPPSPEYGRFDGGRLLRGSVHLQDGRIVRGRIVWDRDERWSFEPLDGETDAAEYAIPFSEIAAIRPLGDDGCEVRLKNDRLLELSGSNDVDGDNRGLIVTVNNGTTVELGWDEFTLVEFE